MNTVLVIVSVASVAFAARCYLELWRWAKQCQNVRIAVAHKKRVQIDAPLTDWLSWGNQLNDDQKERGRIVYRNGYVAVAIVRPTTTGKTRAALVRTIRKTRRHRHEKVPA